MGYEWSVPQDIELLLPRGGVCKIKVQQMFRPAGGEDGRGHHPPGHPDPLAGARSGHRVQLIQFLDSAGTVRFDIDAGRILSQEMEVRQGGRGLPRRGQQHSLFDRI